MLKRVLTTSVIVMSAVLPCTLSAAESAPTRANPTPPRALDLQAPKIGKIFSLAQINAVLSRAVDPSLEHVEVEALRLGDLPLEDNSASPAESIARTVAWLFLPASTIAAVERPAPDATYSHRPDPFLEANYHASFDQP
jgi:hypothetical protein